MMMILNIFIINLMIKMKRRYRDYINHINNDVVYDDYKNNEYNLLFVKELFDKIHCHYKHSLNSNIFVNSLNRSLCKSAKDLFDGGMDYYYNYDNF